MIIDRIENAKNYYCLGAEYEFGLKALEAYQADDFQTGRKDLNGRTYLVQLSYVTKPREASAFKAHRKYADIMYLLEGSENIFYKPTAELRNITKEYDEAGDALLADVDEDADMLLFTPGHFVIFMPQDAHCPGCDAGTAHSVRKVIAKVPV